MNTRQLSLTNWAIVDVMFACEPAVISFGIRNNFHLMTAAEFAAKRLILCYGFLCQIAESLLLLYTAENQRKSDLGGP